MQSPLATPFTQMGYAAAFNTNPPACSDLNTMVTYATSTKPNLTYVTKDGPQYKDFIKRIECNYDSNSQYKLHACLFCWGFLTPGQKKRHLEHQSFFVSHGMFRDEAHFLQLCKSQGKLIQMIEGKEPKVALFNEQCLNVDHSVFGDPSPDQNCYPLKGDGKPYNNEGLIVPYDQFKPRQINSWLNKKGGGAIEENPHTSENSGIPSAKFKNASLQEMLSRIDFWQREQERFNQRILLEFELLKEQHEDLRIKFEQSQTNQQKILSLIKGSQNAKILDQLQQFDDTQQQQPILAITENSRQSNKEELTFKQKQPNPADIEGQFMSLNPEDSPLSDLGGGGDQNQ